MASGLSATCVIEVRNPVDYPSASDTNGGFFSTGASGTDYSYASLPSGGGPKYSLTGLTSSGSGNVILCSTASADMVGNGCYCSAGTNINTAQWYQISSVSVGTSITFTTSNLGNSIATGAASGVAITIGGCLASPGQAAALMATAGMTCWTKYSTSAFVLTTATPGSAGPCTWATNNSTAWLFAGYDQVRGDFTGNKPQISWGSVAAPASNTFLMTLSNNDLSVINWSANGTNTNHVCGFQWGNNRSCVTLCTALNFNGTTGIGFQSTSGVPTNYCYASSCVTGFACPNNNCFASSCTLGFSLGTAYQITRAIASSCTTGFNFANGGALAANCTADACGTGFNNASGQPMQLDSCIASNSTTKGYVFQSVDIITNCAVYNNASNSSGTPTVQMYFNGSSWVNGMITLTQAPYTGSGQFAPNTTSGGGASLRGAATPVITQTDNADVGAIQHADPSASISYVINKRTTILEEGDWLETM